MSKRIFDTPLAALLPESIRYDAGIAAVAGAIDGSLGQLVRGVPNLLLFSRLDPAPGRLSPVMQRLADAAGGLKPLSESELELLAWQFHVDFRDAATTREQLAEMVRQSIPWHRIKGTPASILRALSLFGISARLEEHTSGHWATYQMELDAATHDVVQQAYTVARVMQPVRCRLGRVYNKWNDERIIIHDVQSLWGTYYWEHESGTPVVMPDDETVIVSFGRRTAFHVPCPEPLLAFGKEVTIAFHALHLAHWLWGVSRWGDVYPAQARAFRSHQTATTTGRTTTPWNIRRSRTFFEQIVWDDAHSVWGDDNFRWSLGAFPWHGAQVWGAFHWGDSVDRGVRYTSRRIARTVATRATHSPARHQPLSVEYRRGSIVRPFPPNTWIGHWGARTWQSLGFALHHQPFVLELPVHLYGEAVWGNFIWS